MKIAAGRILIGSMVVILDRPIVYLKALFLPLMTLFIIQSIIDKYVETHFLLFISGIFTTFLLTIIAITTHRLFILGNHSVPVWGLNTFGDKEKKSVLLVEYSMPSAV